MIRRLGMLVLATLGMSACTQIDSLDLSRSFTLPILDLEAEEDSLPEPIQDAAIRVDPPLTRGEFEAEATAETGGPPMPRRKPSYIARPDIQRFDPELLVGLDFEATKTLLGVPALQIEQPPAKVWAYNGGVCTFSVFFYPSVHDKEFRVLTYEVTGSEAEYGRPRAGQPRGGPVKIRDRDSVLLRRCFAELLHSRDLPDAG